jgi:hypothetical protein
MIRHCEDCGQPTGKKWGRYCDAHRWKHRGKPSTYKLTPEREAFLRANYKPSVRGISHRCAKVLGVPKWRVCRWAAVLGLTGPTTKGANWTPEEDAILEAHIGSRHLNWIAKRLNRSITAVVVRAKRREIGRRDARTWYTAHQCALGFGVDPTTAIRWIEKGWLKAKHEGQDYPDGRAAAWRIEHRDVRAFIQAYPTMFTLAKVDQGWFLDLVFRGSIGTREQAA